VCWSKIDTTSMSSKNVDFAVSDVLYPYSRSLNQYTIFLLSKDFMDKSKGTIVFVYHGLSKVT
jgi:hypothetical protein